MSVKGLIDLNWRIVDSLPAIGWPGKRGTRVSWQVIARQMVKQARLYAAPGDLVPSISTSLLAWVARGIL